MTVTAPEIVPMLARSERVVLHVGGRKRPVVDARKVTRQDWRVEFETGPAVTVGAGTTFHRVAR